MAELTKKESLLCFLCVFFLHNVSSQCWVLKSEIDFSDSDVTVGI